ncbi:hypothetical protein FQZ97_1137080 [compost metagenome]
MQALVVYQERHELKHPLELVLGRPFPRALRRRGIRKDDRGCRRCREVCSGLQPPPDRRYQLGGRNHRDVRPVGCEFFTQHLSVPEGDAETVPTAVGRLDRYPGGGGSCRALAQAEHLAGRHVHDGGLHRQFGQ